MDTDSLPALRPGQTTSTVIAVSLGEVTADIPVTLITGYRPGPKLVVTAGVHGGEFVGVEAAVRLGRTLDPAAITGSVVICPVTNPPAVYGGRSPCSPIDGVNLNRVFPGAPAGSPTERLADWVFTRVLPGAAAYLDLHSGGIDETLRRFAGYRLTGDPALDRRTSALAHAVGAEDVVRSPSASGGNSHAAAVRAGIPAVLVESGQLGECRAEDVDFVAGAVVRVMAALGMTDEPPGSVRTREWEWAAFVEADTTGLWYPEVSAGDDVRPGQRIGRLVSPMPGGGARDVVTPAAGRVFYALSGLTVARGAELAAIAG